MALSTEEINKINDLYKQLDVLTAENKLLGERSGDNHTTVLNRLDDLEDLIKELACKCEDAGKKKK